jgi:3-methyladenine DNA glycosylase/8-oxoguanine DNA glycosylase
MTALPRADAPAVSRTFELDRPADLRGTLGILLRGAADPTMRLDSSGAVRASMTPAGPATVELRVEGGSIRVAAWGPGAEAAADGVPALLGLDDDDAGFEPAAHPVVARLARSRPNLRIGRTRSVFEVLLPAILEQRITGTEAVRGYRRLIRSHGTRAPGPHGLWIPPTAAVIAGLPSWAFPALGIEPRRGDLLRRVGREAGRLDALAAPAGRPGGGGAGAAALAGALRRFPGIGPWTAAEVTLRALGDPDAVSIGDAHLSNLVAWTLAGEPRATDERMLELLEPWRGHRARVIRLLETSGHTPPRFGPRVAPRDIREI